MPNVCLSMQVGSSRQLQGAWRGLTTVSWLQSSSVGEVGLWAGARTSAGFAAPEHTDAPVNDVQRPKITSS